MRKSLGYLLFFLTYFLPLSLLAQRAVPDVYSATVKTSYVRSFDIKKPGVNANTLPAELTKDVKQSTSYLDGLGRPFQSVVKEGSLETSSQFKKDMVSATQYDEFGMANFSYLPFVSSASDGNFKLDPFFQQKTFMDAQYGAQSETYFYGQTVVEQSPLSRVKKQLPAGNSWVGAGKGVAVKYWLNAVNDDVKIFTVTDDVSPFGIYTKAGEYAPGDLQKKVSFDEDGKQVIEFTDKDGLVILKKVQLTGARDLSNGMGYADWLCTYYMYDRTSLLRGVIQPEGVKALSSNNWTFDASILAEQCFRYAYDARRRMTRKQVPGTYWQSCRPTHALRF